MRKYLIRLDDASNYMDVEKWNRIKEILDSYEICPIFGIIPDNKDKALVELYDEDQAFWDKMRNWVAEGWIPALHGHEHVYLTEDGGCNPLFSRSEFAGLSYETQCKKIERGYQILMEQKIVPEIFFAPSHTFDQNTLAALKEKTPIRVISDTVAYDVYKDGEFWFVPQQSGRVRKLPFRVVTFCYHPNIMEDKDFEVLDDFLKENRKKFVKYEKSMLKKRKVNILDKVLKKIYFARRS